MTWNTWLSVGVALAVGLLVGSERERSGHGAVAGGVRTFALAAVAGCLAALWGTVPLAAATAGAGVIAAVAYARRAELNSGPVTEVSLVLTVLLGGTAVSSPALAAGAGVATAVILVSKERLHRFARQSITDVEVTDALKFFVVALIILPVIPHARLGPYGAIDPRRIWTLVVAVTGLSWLGYLAVRILGPGRGMPIAGLAGGFVSGAATTGAMARHARTRGLRRAGLAGALMASVATLIQLVAITAIADVHVAQLLAPAAAAGALVLMLEAGLLSLRRRRSRAPAAAPASAAAPSATLAPSAPGAAVSPAVVSQAAAPRVESFVASPGASRVASPGDGSPDGSAEAGTAWVGSPAVGSPAVGSPAVGSPAVGSPAVGSPAVGSPAAESAAAGSPAVGSPAAESAAAGSPTVEAGPDVEPGAAAADAATQPLGRPFALVPALVLAAVLSALLVAARFAQDKLGDAGTLATISAAGLADAHAGALTAATLAAAGVLTAGGGAIAALSAVGVNTIVKLVLAWAGGGPRIALTYALLMVLPVAAVAAAAVATLVYLNGGLVF
jgi:uncharacterized membrane protein (DUF4010 family)